LAVVSAQHSKTALYCICATVQSQNSTTVRKRTTLDSGKMW